MWTHQVEGLGSLADIQTLDLHDHTTVADSAAWVLSEAPERFALAGFSLGGYVSFEIMRRAPERVAGLALVSTSARADTPERHAARHTMIERAEAGGYDTLVAEMGFQAVHPAGPHAQAVVDGIRTMAGRIGRDAFVRQLQVCMDRPDSRGDLSGIACPTLVICGQNDSMTPPELSEEMARGIARAELLLIEECGHYTPMERPKIVTDALRRWLVAK
ncbi:MAG: alpha/beta fold hydrolase [Rhodospirillaceae bacterium]|nr:alpha/beta fold hydrolase [Rhodospirillaceae bacterium]